MKIFDSHIHYYLYEEEVINSLLEEKEYKSILVAVDLDTALVAKETAKKYKFCYPTIGIQPGYIENIDIVKIKDIDVTGYVAIGECGLDATYDVPFEEQKEAFKEQIKLAKKYDLPIIVHSRGAFEDTIQLLEKENSKKVILHCFSYGVEEARKAINNGYYISFAGNVTFKKADNIREAVKIIPLDQLLIETDGPFLAPQPFRGQTNLPLYIIETAKCLALIKGVTVEEILEKTYNNAKRIFNI